MNQVPQFLFLVTSTALVIGAAITIRGLLGFRPVATSDPLPPPVFGEDPADALEDPADALLAHAQASAGDTDTQGIASQEDASTDAPSRVDVAPTPPAVRDLREPIVMTIGGILICTFTLLGISALVNNA